MRVSRSRLVAVALVLAAVGAAFAAGSFASGKRPAVAHRSAALVQRTFVSAASGNDANPCTRTAPCRNFAAAIAQTQPGGEVIVLDSGGYGTVTITQAVSIVAPPGVYAGISVFSGTGITINAGPSDTVTISGLTFNGLGGTDGIDYNSGAALHVENSVFKGLSGAGISGEPLSTGGSLVVDDSLFTRSGTEGVVVGAPSGTTRATIEHCRFEDGFEGVLAGPNANVVVRDSVATGNSSVGFFVDGSHLDLENSLATHNGTGLDAVNGGNMRVSETTIEENTFGLVTTNGITIGTITSFGNNRLAGNTTNGSFSSTIPLQ
jgi:hypothetical protein